MPIPIEVLEIEELDLRRVFPREDTAFTPWLAEPANLARLARALHLDLEVIATEVRTGTFRTDILARCVDDDTIVVIENQFGRSDHDHLGKSLTYLAAHEAKTVVWIAESFADEHRSTLQWLNDNTPEDVAFFGVVPRLVRVGDSAPGLRFDLEVRPNHFIKKMKQQGRQLAAGVGALREMFWPVFVECVERDAALAAVPRRYGGRLSFLWLLPPVAESYAAFDPHLLVYVSARANAATQIGLALSCQGESESVDAKCQAAWNAIAARLVESVPNATVNGQGLVVPADLSSPEAAEAAIRALLPAVRLCVDTLSAAFAVG